MTTCPDCGCDLIKQREGEYKCPQCKKTYLDDFGKIRTFLEENPNASIQDIVNNVKVPRRVINEYIDYCHLEYSGSSYGYSVCQYCGATLRCGTICPACAEKGEARRKDFNPYKVGDYKYRNGQNATEHKSGITGSIVPTDQEISGEADKIRFLKNKK